MTKKVQYPKLPKRFKARWVKALRSDEYMQGKAKLKREVQGEAFYCCIGVAADIIGCEWMEEAEGLLPAYGGKYLSDHGALLDSNISELMPKELRPLVELVEGTMVQDILASKNDGNDGAGDPWSFKRIATWIEKHL